jgi:membrane dipeptidase
VLKHGNTQWPGLDDFIDHVDRVVDLTGSTNHIGIGTDMSLGTYPDHQHDPWGDAVSFASVTGAYDKHITGDVRSPMRALKDFNSYPEVVNLIEKLLSRNYSDEDVAKILGENYLRVFDQVWKPTVKA